MMCVCGMCSVFCFLVACFATLGALWLFNSCVSLGYLANFGVLSTI